LTVVNEKPRPDPPIEDEDVPPFGTERTERDAEPEDGDRE
jgi:hypothetical protein